MDDKKTAKGAAEPAEDEALEVRGGGLVSADFEGDVRVRRKAGLAERDPIPGAARED